MRRELNGMIGTDWQPVINSGAALWDPRKDENVLRQLDWLEEYEGIGSYFFDNIFGQIYFERDEDREMFLLRWS